MLADQSLTTECGDRRGRARDAKGVTRPGAAGRLQKIGWPASEVNRLPEPDQS